MASIGKDDLFDEETVRLYLKEVKQQWTQLIMLCLTIPIKKTRKKSEKISKARESDCSVSVLGKIDIGKLC